MRSLREIFYANDHRRINKFPHYLDIYDRYFAKFRGQEIRIMEIGVGHGGSLQMWKEYFGDKVQVIGVDCQELDYLKEERIDILRGDQGDRGFLKSVVDRYLSVDIVIDDGSHQFLDQVTSFWMLYPLVSPDGLYLVEDLHHVPEFYNFAGAMTAKLYDWDAPTAKFTRETKAIHFYNGIIVFEKSRNQEFIGGAVMTGEG
jgi:hypothetical protein